MFLQFLGDSVFESPASRRHQSSSSTLVTSHQEPRRRRPALSAKRIRVTRHEPPAIEAPAVGLGHGSVASRRALPSKSSNASSRAQWVPACSKARATAAATARRSGVLSRTLRDRGRTRARQAPVRSTRLRTSNGAPRRPPSDGAAAIRPAQGRALPRATAYKIIVPSIPYLGSHRSTPPGYASS